MRKEDKVFLLIVALVWIVVGVVSPFVLSDLHKREEYAALLKAKQCVVYSREATGNKVYCGKACYRDEIRTLYSCNDGPRWEVN